MRDLLTDPAWRPEDLGQPLPDSPHAVSVAMPLWEHVVGYEEEDPRIIDRLRCGYPRFFCHPFTRRLFAAAGERHGRPGEAVVVFPSAGAATRAVAYVERDGLLRNRMRIEPLAWGRLHAVLGPGSAMGALMEYWRFSGEIVSSRLAELALGEASDVGFVGGSGVDGDPVVDRLKARLAELSGQSVEDVFLFGSGMLATFTVHRMFEDLLPGGESLQIDFPYVDVLKVQKHFGRGSVFVPVLDDDAWGTIGAGLRERRYSGVFCELASNPLMRCLDVARLSASCRAAEVPVCIDDTIATIHNADVFPHADVVTTSLTKYFAGTGDVMAGSVIVNRGSPFAAAFRAWLRANESEGSALADVDACVLLDASNDFARRMERVNESAEAVVELLSGHPVVERVRYPGQARSGADAGWFAQIQRPGRGRGGLLSVEFRDAARNAPRFYDRLEVSKGPSFGARFTLACPYTILAHYRELEWAESCGVERWLVRVGVGTEDPSDLVRRFERALAVCG